jgi:peptide/nickel transport system permease protein
MVAEGATYIVSGEWWLALFPGAVLMLAVFASTCWVMACAI